MTKKQALFSAAISGLLIVNTGCVSGTKKSDAATAAATEPTGECHGINSCKGKGQCGGKGHSCAGENKCKGKGWLPMTAKECKEKGGKFKA